MEKVLAQFVEKLTELGERFLGRPLWLRPPGGRSSASSSPTSSWCVLRDHHHSRNGRSEPVFK